MMSFPSALTDEEKELREIFEKLKRARKAVEAAKKGTAAQPLQAASKVENRVNKRSVEEAEFATEEVKKRIKAGQITVHRRERDKHLGFKRSHKNAVRRELDEASASLGHHMEDLQSSSFSSSRHKKLAASEEGELQDGDGDQVECHDSATILVAGYNLAMPLLQNTFGCYGRIVDMDLGEDPGTYFTSMNSTGIGSRTSNGMVLGWLPTLATSLTNWNQPTVNHCISNFSTATVTFDSAKAAHDAITKMDGNMVNGSAIQVSMAYGRIKSGGQWNLGSMAAGHTGVMSSSQQSPPATCTGFGNQGFAGTEHGGLGDGKQVWLKSGRLVRRPLKADVSQSSQGTFQGAGRKRNSDGDREMSEHQKSGRFSDGNDGRNLSSFASSPPVATTSSASHGRDGNGKEGRGQVIYDSPFSA